MAGIKGKTNNPNGRPPKSRALTDLLDKALNHTLDMDGKRASGKVVLAKLVSDVLTTGRLQFPGDTETSMISVKDWLEFVKWAYAYLEPPTNKTALLDKNGEDMKIIVTLKGQDDE